MQAPGGSNYLLRRYVDREYDLVLWLFFLHTSSNTHNHMFGSLPKRTFPAHTSPLSPLSPLGGSLQGANLLAALDGDPANAFKVALLLR